ELRKNLAPAERKLWSRLRGGQIGYRFRRQHPVGKYIIDFYCHEARLGIELDGDSHFGDGREDYDERRAGWLAAQGIKIIRFVNPDVFDCTDAVLQSIADECERRVRLFKAPTQPPPAGEE